MPTVEVAGRPEFSYSSQVTKKEGFYTTCLLERFPGDWMWMMELDLG
jgi:hypothetical protein